MKITGTTRVAAIFGDPVTHSMSPVIQNAAFAELGIDAVYVPFHVRPDDLGVAVASIRTLGLMGVNITIPHKEQVIPHLDRVDEAAKRIGAVNTIVNKDGVLTGYNTDGAGFMASIKAELGFDARGKNVVVLGAGGAARAVLYALMEAGAATVTVANRTAERAERLIDELGGFFPATNVAASGFAAGQLKGLAEGADLVVNTTSLGMEGQPPLGFPVDSLEPTAIVSDIVYKPIVTELVREARARGLAADSGLGMLVYQGVVGFELWTGKKAPADVMMRAARAALGV